jgi:hypothetical protein
VVSPSGELERVFDLRSAKALGKFTKLIKNFLLSDCLKESAKQLGLPEPSTVKTPTELLTSLLYNDWRVAPMSFDVPANSQIFGHLILSAGIEGIIYPSKLTKKDCLVIFPQNFEQTASFIQLDDQVPHDRVPSRVDGSNWRVCDLSFNELPSLNAPIIPV